MDLRQQHTVAAAPMAVLGTRRGAISTLSTLHASARVLHTHPSDNYSKDTSMLSCVAVTFACCYVLFKELNFYKNYKSKFANKMDSKSLVKSQILTAAEFIQQMPDSSAFIFKVTWLFGKMNDYYTV